MKTQTIVTEVTYEDLVRLFSAATYGSSWIGISIPEIDNTKFNKDDCLEDMWAKVLLNGKSLYFHDYYAEDADDFYGNLPHWSYFETPNNGFMRYTFTLDDIKKGVAKALDSGDYIAEYIHHWTDDDCCEFDNPQAEAIMQWIIFGEEIYG